MHSQFGVIIIYKNTRHPARKQKQEARHDSKSLISKWGPAGCLPHWRVHERPRDRDLWWFRQRDPAGRKREMQRQRWWSKKGTNTVTQGIWVQLPPCSLPGRGAELMAVAVPGPQQHLQPWSSCPAPGPGTTWPSPRHFYFRCFSTNTSQEKCFRKTQPCKASGTTGKCSVSVCDTRPPKFLLFSWVHVRWVYEAPLTVRAHRECP